MDIVEKNWGYFLQQLEWANVEKKKEDPVALVIRARDDFNGMLSASPAQSLLLQISKTHRILIKVIESVNQFALAIKKGSGEVGKKISLLLIMAHGYPDRIQFGKKKAWYAFWEKPFYERRHILRDDFSPLDPDSKIVLYACFTGQRIAQDIANISHRIVYAVMGILWDTKTCLQNWPDPDIKIVSYNEKNEQQMQVFTPNHPPIFLSLSGMFAKENKSSFCQMSHYLQRAALEQDKNAQWKLAMLYLLGVVPCANSYQTAAYWLQRAASQGVAEAQFELGKFYLLGIGGLGQSSVEAGHWFSLSANQKFPAALFQMGEAFLNGRYGFRRSDEKAAQFFALAAAKGVKEALFNLGVLYEHARGVRRSLNYAKHLYKITSNLGISEAKARLDYLEQSEKNQKFRLYATVNKIN